ncbi:hypothetical protein [Virgisporangium aurantiacum]|uniref:Uncharacterized protein n=1 Tax=Virgisporangium aurantiacum TaxID=175570 RepID=A0A8J3Z4W4_9ACTN|nr:hypothetical protein [Virgisporangium aurantiacum]GIJ56467.1 hypothetical protein Vau01_039830 [Virgisporangium aurantiacum]
MTDFDRSLSATLERAAGDDVHVEGLLAGARRAGVRYRRRRVGLVTGAGLAAGLAALVVTMTVLGPNGGPASAPQYGSTPGSPVGSSKSAAPPRHRELTTWPAPPAATATTALRLRLSLAQPPFAMTSVQHQLFVDERQENLYVDGAERRLTVRFGATTQDFEPLDGQTRSVSVSGRPATFAVDRSDRGNGTVLRWRTADGRWLQIVGAADETEALRIAASVRTDGAFRCVVPFRLGHLPAGMTAESCSMVFTGDGVVMTTLSVSDGAFHVLFDTTTQGSGRSVSETQHPGDGGASIMESTAEQPGGGAVSLTASGAYDVALVRAIRNGLVWTGGTDPATWPADPM